MPLCVGDEDYGVLVNSEVQFEINIADDVEEVEEVDNHDNRKVKASVQTFDLFVDEVIRKKFLNLVFSERATM